MTRATESCAGIEVLRGSPTDVELAAALAVIDAMAAEPDDEMAPPVTTSAWQRTQRAGRVPLHTIGAWRSFSG
ncbi:acyl-CoA carboxylase subunit epsilon [Marisediminicola sp. LYQ134]|uniref:acyl-CoA carboxylase subunit epsilon n=1 Tax=unclassified Marisediminicola TaxID=2618316 RepID=UPI0039837B69